MNAGGRDFRNVPLIDVSPLALAEARGGRAYRLRHDHDPLVGQRRPAAAEEPRRQWIDAPSIETTLRLEPASSRERVRSRALGSGFYDANSDTPESSACATAPRRPISPEGADRGTSTAALR
jgi:hypothetical protein